MSQGEFAVNFFVALFALLDPIGNVPLFAAATAGAKSRDRAWIALYISLFVLGFLTFFYFSGLSLLEFFGISLPAFRIAGGVILFLLGLEMARDDFTASYAEAADAPRPRGGRLAGFDVKVGKRTGRLLLEAGPDPETVLIAFEGRGSLEPTPVANVRLVRSRSE